MELLILAYVTAPSSRASNPIIFIHSTLFEEISIMTHDERSSYFEAAMSANDVKKGEMLHSEIEKLRRIAMMAGLTKSNAELSTAYETDPKTFWDALEYSVRSYDHYVNILELLTGAVSRLSAIAKEIPDGDVKKDYKQIAKRAAEIITYNSPEIEH